MFPLDETIKGGQFFHSQPDRDDLHGLGSPPRASTAASLQLFHVVAGLSFSDPRLDHVFSNVVLTHANIVNENRATVAYSWKRAHDQYADNRDPAQTRTSSPHQRGAKSRALQPGAPCTKTVQRSAQTVVSHTAQRQDGPMNPWSRIAAFLRGGIKAPEDAPEYQGIMRGTGGPLSGFAQPSPTPRPSEPPFVAEDR